VQPKVFQLPSQINALDMVMSLPSTKNAETPMHTKSQTKVFNSATTDQKIAPPDTAYLEDSKNPNSGLASPKNRGQQVFGSAKQNSSPKASMIILSSHTPGEHFKESSDLDKVNNLYFNEYMPSSKPTRESRSRQGSLAQIVFKNGQLDI